MEHTINQLCPLTKTHQICFSTIKMGPRFSNAMFEKLKTYSSRPHWLDKWSLPVQFDPPAENVKNIVKESGNRKCCTHPYTRTWTRREKERGREEGGGEHYTSCELKRLGVVDDWSRNGDCDGRDNLLAFGFSILFVCGFLCFLLLFLLRLRFLRAIAVAIGDRPVFGLRTTKSAVFFFSFSFNFNFWSPLLRHFLSTPASWRGWGSAILTFNVSWKSNAQII